MASIEDLVEAVADPALRARLAEEVRKLKVGKRFGLVFEEHVPETVRLPGLAIRRGTRVVRWDGADSETFVASVRAGGGTLRVVPERGGDAKEVPEGDIVPIKRCGEPIYPALVPVESVARGGGKPWHVLINAENFHALQLLLYSHEGQVDAIYIDPPYNTGARDWKYNNCYVDGNDAWRHSKWLAFMSRRLRLAKRLLRPDSGVLVVTIDEHEVQHLGVLLEEMFPSARRQLVTIVNNAAGVSQGGLWRVEEYAYFCWVGNAQPAPIGDDLLSDETKPKKTVLWFSLVRAGGVNATPARRPGLVYPIAIDPKTNRVVGTGRTLKDRVASGEVKGALKDWRPNRSEKVKGCPVVWPYNPDGSLYTWQVGPDRILALAADGFLRVRPYEGSGGNKWSISYIRTGHQKKILSGAIPTRGREGGDGPYILGEAKKSVVPKTVWKRARHDAGKWGSRTLRELLGDVSFDYAKSPYAVLDTLRVAVGSKPNALILDFFAGSGTTLHATALLNAEDGGSRRCVIVTNNEVGEADARRLTAGGLRPGAPEWERNGISESVTWPRVRAAILGKRIDKTPVPGEYLSGAPMSQGLDENAAYFRLDFLDPNDVSRGESFAAILPILWIAAGGIGECPRWNGERKWLFPPQNPFAVLFREENFREFRAEVMKRPTLVPGLTHIFLVTDSPDTYREMTEQLPKSLTKVQLYRSYLDTFRINLEERQ